MFVKDLMNVNPIVCLEDTPLIQVYEMMLENECDYVAVIDGYSHKIPIGIITEHDICLMTIVQGRNPKQLTAADVMNTNISKAIYSKSLMDCTDLIENSKTKRLLITDENGGLCGMLTQANIENSKTNQHFEDLMSLAMAKEQHPFRLNRIF